jgi:hypothetical protein
VTKIKGKQPLYPTTEVFNEPYFFRYLRNVTVEGGFGKPDIAFSSDGTLKSVELKIMNLRPGISSNLVWEVVRIFLRLLLS